VKKILVIGGSYFMGRVFVILASRTGEFDITVVNRGRFKLNLERVSQIHFDRHDTDSVRNMLPDTEYDAVVDFCAYEPGDISSFVGNIPRAPRQYIYISTCSVYDVAAIPPITEESPVGGQYGNDQMSSYAAKKQLLETELMQACALKGIRPTILRPTMIYGPLNYAPREPWFFNAILQDQAIPVPDFAKAKFNFVYVKDTAAFLMAVAGNPDTYDQIYNLAAPEEMDYASFISELESCAGGPLKKTVLSRRLAADRGISFPFPTDLDEVYDGSKITRATGLRYTPFSKAFRETYDIYMSAYQK